MRRMAGVGVSAALLQARSSACRALGVPLRPPASPFAFVPYRSGGGKLENKMCILIYFVFRSGTHQAVLFFSYPVV